jgi:hypothetical protein
MALRLQVFIVLVVPFAGTHSNAQGTEVAQLKTFSAIGKEKDVLNGFHEVELMRHEGRGCLTHMWFGGNWDGYELTRIRVYVDGEKIPSIDMELGLGHGVGFADSDAPWGCRWMGKTGHRSGVYNTYRIPFGNGIRVTGQRSRESPDGAPFWWIIRGTENLPISLGGVRLPDSTRLRLYKREDHTAQPLEEFNLCNLKGAGAVYQVTIAARATPADGTQPNLAFLEACMRAYFGSTQEPTFLSSGLEDYFLGTYYFNRGKYATDVAGLTHLDKQACSFSAYRFHDEDPIFFTHGLRLTCRCGEKLEGHVFHKPTETTYSTYTWVYQW